MIFMKYKVINFEASKKTKKNIYVINHDDLKVCKKIKNNILNAKNKYYKIFQLNIKELL